LVALDDLGERKRELAALRVRREVIEELVAGHGRVNHRDLGFVPAAVARRPVDLEN
jgi:hypothetical protein